MTKLIEGVRHIRLVLGLPAYGLRVDARQSRMWFSLGYALAANEAKFTMRGFPIVDRCGVDVARNEMVQAALAACCDERESLEFGDDGAWLLMVDADTWYDGDLQGGFDLLRMIRDAERVANIGIIAAPVPARRPRGDANTYMVYKERAAYERTSPSGPLPKLRALERHEFADRLVDVDSVATALMAINLRALMGCPQPWFDYRYTTPGTLDTQGEDIYCCNQLRDRGWRIVVDGRFTASHVNRGEVLE